MRKTKINNSTMLLIITEREQIIIFSEQPRIAMNYIQSENGAIETYQEDESSIRTEDAKNPNHNRNIDISTQKSM